jgi:transposase
MIVDLPVRPGLRILVTSRPVDFRRGMDSLTALVKETLAVDPFAGEVFVFRAKRADRLKILLWDGSARKARGASFPRDFCAKPKMA